MSSQESWDYLILTASDQRQAGAYEAQVRLRQSLGLLAGVREALVVPDPGGKRVGSGGSTVCCLGEVLSRELKDDALDDQAAWREALSRLRILIVHGGGDSTRLPAYGPCGKVFVPVPGSNDTALAATLFDRQLPTYLALPGSQEGAGQVVITSGDVLVRFDPSEVVFASEGLTGLGSFATPEQASKHGVYCADGDGRVKRFLQKPTPDEQADQGAVDRHRRTILDVGVISFDAATAVSLLRVCGARAGTDGRLVWTGEVGEAISSRGLDFYREICCAMGSDATRDYHAAAARASGSQWDDTSLGKVFDALSATPFHVDVLSPCDFLHFGTTRQIIASGIDLARQDTAIAAEDGCLRIQSSFAGAGSLAGRNAWIEGCRIRSTLTLGGDNVVVGVDIDAPLELPRGACLDVVCGKDRRGQRAWFVRCYGIDDHFKRTVAGGATFCARPVSAWLESLGARPADVWESGVSPERRTLGNAHLFPAADDPQGYRDWLWMFAPEATSADQRRAWLAADRYSLAEIARLADHDAFHGRRALLRAEEVRHSLHRIFRGESEFSWADLWHLLAKAEDRAAWVAEILAEARSHLGDGKTAFASTSFACSRILHTLASSLAQIADNEELPLLELLPGLDKACRASEQAWLQELGLAFSEETTAGDWVRRARSCAFDCLGRTIVLSGSRISDLPKSALRADEIVWGRAPARLDVGGGWTDTPPYSLEHGGCVVNAAVDLNGQPPIQAYGRVIPEPVVRITSIDHGARLEIADFDGLLDYSDPCSEFALPKAALALSGLSPDCGVWPEGTSLRSMLQRFGGGIELTTSAAVPKGSGLGTSSILGAVLLAVIQRMMGRRRTRQELFHNVLQLEQALTTGGGWQDQVGGVVESVKVITTQPGLVPDVTVRFVPANVLDPAENGNQTLLYYTGITRLAKDILHQVVGRYLDRHRAAMATLRELRDVVLRVADAMARKDLPAFGRLVGRVWELNKRIDPGATSPEIEALLERIKPFAYGAKLLGAGGGGFLLIVCKSLADAAQLRAALEAEPPNERARFFDYQVSHQGLAVTVC